MFWQQNEISTVICSSWAPKRKKKLLFSVSLASHAVPLETRRQQEGGWFWAQWQKLQRKTPSLKTRMFKTCEIRVCFNRKSSKAPCTSTDSIDTLSCCTKMQGRSSGRGQSLEGLGETSLSGKYMWKLYLKMNQPFSWPYPSVIRSDQTQTSFQQGPGWVGTVAWLRLGGWNHNWIRWCSPLSPPKSTHVTRPSSVRPATYATARGNSFSN